MKQVIRYILISSLIVSMVPTSVFAADIVDDELVAQVNDSLVDNLSPDDSGQAVAAAEPPVAVDTTQAVGDPAPIQADHPADVSTVEPAPDVTLRPTPIPANADIIVSGFDVQSGRLQAIELRNMTDKLIDLGRFAVEAVYLDDTGSEASCRVSQLGYIYAKQYVTIVQSGVTVNVDHSDDTVAYDAALSCDDASGVLVSIEVVAVDAATPEVVERVLVEDAAPALNGRWIRKTTGSYRTGMIADFVAPGKADARSLYYGELYQPPYAPPLTIIEMYMTPPLCAPDDVALTCVRYVKVRNDAQIGDAPLDLGRYRLRAGLPTSSSTATNTTTLRGYLAPGEVTFITQAIDGRSVYIGSSEGSAWFEDRLGLVSYREQSKVAPYVGAGTVARTGLSWAFDPTDNEWKWSLPSPDTVENIIRLPASGKGAVEPKQLVPCNDNQYRSEETGRCRAIATTAALTPCKDGQYRSEQTNRCRTIALAGGTLVPCKDNQYRSEETNRCRLIATAASNLVPCKDNQYRSEETNRCRTIVSTTIPAAAFAVEPIADTGKAFVGWWVLGGVGLIAVGYAAWEWRREVSLLIRRIGGVFKVSK